MKEGFTRTLISWWIRLVAAATLVVSQGLAYQPGEALAQGSLRQLTEDPDHNQQYTRPSISADGTRIAFIRGEFRWRAELYVVNSDGTGLRRLVGANLIASSPPSMSADGQWIAFAATDTGTTTYGYRGDIYLMRTDGTGLRQLSPALTGNPDEDAYLRGSRYTPAISGDGSLVVFSSNADFTRQNGDGNDELFAVRADGTGLTQVTNISSTGEKKAYSPSLDYRGSRVAFFLTGAQEGAAEETAALPPPINQSLYVVNTDGSGLRKLSVAAYDYAFPEDMAWGPDISGDGSLVAFAARIHPDGGKPGTNLGLHIIKADGTGLRQLTTWKSRSLSLPFDGSRIAFAAEIPGWGYEVFVMNTDGTGLTQLTSTPATPPISTSGYFGVALSADGSYVAFASHDDLLGRNADLSAEIYLQRLASLLPVQGVRNRRTAADLANNRFSLVARRDLVVRAFFDTGVGGAAVAARGRLVVDEGTPREATFQVDGYTARPLGYFDDKPEARQRLEDSLNFFITGPRADELLTPGTHTFKARVEPTGAGFAPWEETFQATFRQPDTVDVFVIPVQVRNAAGALVAPDAALIGGASDFLRATYPLDEHNTRVRNIALAPLEVHWPIPFDQPGAPDPWARRRQLARQIRARLDAQLLLGQVAFGLFGGILKPARQNFAAGVVPYAVDGLNPIGVLGYTFPSIRGVVVSLDRMSAAPNQPVIGSTMAHEIGHQLGLGDEYTSPSARPSPNNPPPATAADGTSTGNYVLEIARGLDTANRLAVFHRAGAEVFGYMGGGHDRNSWATGIDYAFLYSRVTTDTVGGSQVSAAAQTRFINVSGVVSQTGGVQLDPFLVATSSYTFTRPSGAQYSFQFKDGSGGVLDTVGFDVDFSLEIVGEGYLPVDQAPFSFTVPLPEGVASMVALTGTTPMITYTVSAQPPAVTVLAPNGGETLRERSQVRWQASDPDGDPLTYTVIYSPNGTDRYVVATNVTTTTLDLDFSRLPPGDRAYVIVRASDGFNYAEDASDAPLVAGPWRVFLPFVAQAGGGW